MRVFGNPQVKNGRLLSLNPDPFELADFGAEFLQVWTLYIGA